MSSEDGTIVVSLDGVHGPGTASNRDTFQVEPVEDQITNWLPSAWGAQVDEISINHRPNRGWLAPDLSQFNMHGPETLLLLIRETSFEPKRWDSYRSKSFAKWRYKAAREMAGRMLAETLSHSTNVDWDISEVEFRDTEQKNRRRQAWVFADEAMALSNPNSFRLLAWLHIEGPESAEEIIESFDDSVEAFENLSRLYFVGAIKMHEKNFEISSLGRSILEEFEIIEKA